MMRVTYLVVLFLLLPACRETSSEMLSLNAPGRIDQALSVVDDVQAQARLVPLGGQALEPVALSRSDDGVSFSGFVPAEPGEYILEVVFSGLADDLGRVFLGRLSSDQFSVSQGDVTSARFSRPLDPLGRDEDEGDADDDGMATLDELLWGCQPNNPDSDDDGVVDGLDCEPLSSGINYEILEGGSHEDCDADGARRVNLPWGDSGQDCNDRDPQTYPGAEDSCDDGIDQDCNPSTCPGERTDFTGPVISGLSPAQDEPMGCHHTLAAIVVDESEVASVTATMINCPLGGSPRVFYMHLAENNKWESSALNTLASVNGYVEACEELEIVARDMMGNETSLFHHLNFDFSVPTVVDMSPANLDTSAGPVTVTVQASVANGEPTVELMRAPKQGLGFALDYAVSLGRHVGTSVNFTVDATGLDSGEYLIYPLLRDAYENRLQPASGALVSGDLSSDYWCLGDANAHNIPARVLVVGESQARAALMRDHLDQAMAMAAAEDPAAHLVSAKAFGLGADGRVDLTDASSYMKRWEYGFYNAGSGTWLSVSWFTPAYATSNPVLDNNAGNIVETLAVDDPALLVDSDRVAQAFAANAACGTLSGDDSDFVAYKATENGPEVLVNSAAGQTFRAGAVEPMTLIYACE